MSTLIVVAVILIFIILSSAIRICKEYERGVIFRLGRLVGARGPGLFLIIPGIEKMVRITLRTVVMDVPPQDVITKDNVSIKVNAVIYFRVMSPQEAVVQVGTISMPTASWPRPPCAAS
jgi:regulator of protease activity HflC (stomatin/prohibitin superfamily)